MQTIHENERFVITVESLEPDETIELAGAYFFACYYVTNKMTGVVEVKTPGLLEAIMYAENCDRMLDNKPWEWARQAQLVSQSTEDGPLAN